MSDSYAFEAAAINYVLLCGQVDHTESWGSRRSIIFDLAFYPDVAATRELFEYLVANGGMDAVKWDTVRVTTENVRYTTGTFDETGSYGDIFTLDFETVDGRKWRCSVPVDSMAQVMSELPVIPGEEEVGRIAMFVLSARPPSRGWSADFEEYPDFPLMKGAKVKVMPLYEHRTPREAFNFGPDGRKEEFAKRLRQGS